MLRTDIYLFCETFVRLNFTTLIPMILCFQIFSFYVSILIVYFYFLFVRMSHVRLALFLTYSQRNNKRVHKTVNTFHAYYTIKHICTFYNPFAIWSNNKKIRQTKCILRSCYNTTSRENYNALHDPVLSKRLFPELPPKTN